MGLRILKLMTVLLFVTGIFSCTKNKLSSEKEILSFNIYGVEGEISEVSAGGVGTVELSLPSAIGFSLLKPKVTVSDKATIYPNEISADYSYFYAGIAKPYTVIAEDGSRQRYDVTVHARQPKIPLNDILDLYLQPLSVIQEQMQGKWKLQYVYGGIAGQISVDKNGNYMHITKERIIWGDNTGIMMDLPIVWAKSENFWERTHDAHYIPFPSTFLIKLDSTYVPLMLTQLYVHEVIPRSIKDSYLFSPDFSADGYNLYFTKYE
ncbi:MAG: hypothetical protein FWE30_05645 [Bacteroidales bacterium]|nr:hypothetical protein [Bacteroidales bacterium]